MPLQGVDQRDGVGARRLGGRGDRRRVGRVGVSLAISGLSRQRAHALDGARGLGRVGAHDQAGLDVRAGEVELDQRDLVARRRPPRPARPARRGRSPSPTTNSGTGSSASCGRSSARKPLEALVRQADRVDQPGRRLPQPRRRVALARRERDRLRDEASNGKCSSSASPKARRAAIASKVPEPLRIGPRERRRRRGRSRRCPGTARQLARPRRAPGRRRRRARSRRASARRSRSRRRSRRPSPTRARAGPARRARRRARARPRASAAGRRRRRSACGSRVELRAQQLGDQPVAAGRAVVGRRRPASPANSARRLGVAGRAEAEQRPAPRRRRRAARRPSRGSARAPMPPPTSSGRRPSRGARRSRCRAGRAAPSAVARLELAEPARAGADVLEQERQVGALPPGSGDARERERARQVRAARRLPRPSARRRRACRTGPGAGSAARSGRAATIRS